MPGSVANAVVSEVMPALLASQFTRSDSWAVQQNRYANGEVESRSQVTSSLRRWEADLIGDAAALADWKDFWEDTKHAAFYFYDPFEPVSGQPIGSNFDATGVATTGRYKVAWEGSWSQQMTLGRFSARMALVEVA